MQEFTKTFCRCCLQSENSKDFKLLDMNEHSFVYNNQPVSLADSYLETTGCFVGGKLSRMSVPVSKICQGCIKKLTAAYIFKMFSLEANGILEQQYESEVAAKQPPHQKLNDVSSQYSNLYEKQAKPRWTTKVDKGYSKMTEVPVKTFARDYHNVKEETAKANYGFSCTICNKSYKLYGSLKAHKLFKHEKVSNYKYKCTQCHKKCPTMFILKAHMDTHTAEPTHKCEICSASYKHRTYLLQHMKKHTFNSESYRCVPCSLSFKNSRAFAFHSLRCPVASYSRRVSRKPAPITSDQNIARKGVEQQRTKTHIEYSNDDDMLTIENMVKQEMVSDEESSDVNGISSGSQPSRDLDKEIYANKLVKMTMNA